MRAASPVLPLLSSIALAIALGRRRADHAHEQRPDRRRHHRELPVHPLLRLRPLPQVGRLEAAFVLGREVAHDRVRLPEGEAVFLLDRRHQAVGFIARYGFSRFLPNGPPMSMRSSGSRSR
jgi:hypothetical protein